MRKAKRLSALLMVTVLAAGMISGCGKPDPDPNSGLYEAVSAQMMGMSISVAEVYENGVSFELQDGGKCVANLNGETFKIKWSTEGDRVHIEGQGVDLNGTIGGGDMTLENMMDMGLDMSFHCDELLHAAEAGDGNSSGGTDSVLSRLKDAKNGKDVYGKSESLTSSSNDTGDIEPGLEEGTISDGEASGASGDGVARMSIVNPDYESVNGDTYEIGGLRLLQPKGWNFFEESDNSVRIMVGTDNKDDYIKKTSAVIEWHPGASGSIDTSNYSDPVNIEADYGSLVYKGTTGNIPGGWVGLLMMAEHGDGYILVTLTGPPDDYSIDVTSPEFNAILASVETK